MCMKLRFGDLNSDSSLPLPTSIYICRVNNAPKVRSGELQHLLVQYEDAFTPTN